MAKIQQTASIMPVQKLPLIILYSPDKMIGVIFYYGVQYLFVMGSCIGTLYIFSNDNILYVLTSSNSQ